MTRFSRLRDPWTEPSRTELAEIEREQRKEREMAIRAGHVRCPDGWTRRRVPREESTSVGDDYE